MTSLLSAQEEERDQHQLWLPLALLWRMVLCKSPKPNTTPYPKGHCATRGLILLPEV